MTFAAIAASLIAAETMDVMMINRAAAGTTRGFFGTNQSSGRRGIRLVDFIRASSHLQRAQQAGHMITCRDDHHLNSFLESKGPSARVNSYCILSDAHYPRAQRPSL